MLTYYHVLGVDRASTLEEIKERMRELSRTTHPDKGGDALAYADLTVAYSVLKCARAKKEYDDRLAMLHEQCGPCDGEGRRYKQKGLLARTSTRCTVCGGSGVNTNPNRRNRNG